MATTGLRWVTPPDKLADALHRYGEKLIPAIAAVAQVSATEMENDARQNATWVDRTGNARSGLFGKIEVDRQRKVVTIFLSHAATLDYPIWLELAHGGKFAIINRTIDQHLPKLASNLQGILE